MKVRSISVLAKVISVAPRRSYVSDPTMRRATVSLLSEPLMEDPGRNFPSAPDGGLKLPSPFLFLDLELELEAREQLSSVLEEKSK